MLQAYANQTDIPEALREHYSKREDGKWHADIPDEHPAVKHNAKLLSEKNTAEGKVAQLTSDLESARAGNLGRGQVAMAKSDAQLLDQYKALGTPDEVGAQLTKGKTDAEELAKRSREDSLRKVSKALEFNEEAFVLLPNLPEFVVKSGKDGKDEWFAQVKDDKGVITEKPAKEFVESSAQVQPFMAALKTSPHRQVEVPGSHMTTNVNQSSGDPFEWARSFGKQWNEDNKATTDVAATFGIGRSA